MTVRNLIAGLKLALLFPPVRSDEFGRSLTRSLLMVVMGVVALALFGYSEQVGEIYFNDFGAAVLGTALFAATIVALVVTRSQGSLDRFPDLVTPLAATFPWVVAALSGLRHILLPVADSGLYWLLALVWCISVFIRAIHITFPRASAVLFVGTATVTAGLAFGVSHRGHSPDLFYSYDSTEYEQYASMDQEDVFLSQTYLLEEELQRILPSRPEDTELYFIGFAGNGDESVFASEANFVRDQVADEFLTEGRSLVLASEFDSVNSQPLANTHNLFRAISHIGEKMDVEDDVFFLFLTSHGSKDATIQVSLFPLQLKQLSAEELRGALDAAKIEWRIIVVSACYSGSFIEPLMTDKTIVMTASAAQKTSFGCSNDRDLTYFGEAFFRDSFGNGSSLLETFAKAKASISEREIQEGLSSSDPQIFVGAEMEQKLAQISANKQKQLSVDH